MLPKTIAPMLAQPRAQAFDSDDYLFEIKWDGTRALAFIRADGVTLQNRRLLHIEERYPELNELRSLPADTVLDGEIVVLKDGKSDFARLQQRDSLSDPLRIEVLSQRMPVTFVAFDLLYLNSNNLQQTALFERRELLKSLLNNMDLKHVIHSEVILSAGIGLFEAIRQQQMEGIMAKRLDSHYHPGERPASWLKIKVSECDVFTILGYVPRDDGSAVSALILGEEVDGQWQYRGKVGTGFNETQRQAMLQHLSQLTTSGYALPQAPAQTHWIKAQLRARIRYFEITSDNRLRSPVFEHFVADD